MLSTEKEAAVYCEVGRLVTEELHRHTLQKGLWNRLLNPLRAYRREVGDLEPWEELPDKSFEEMFGMHPIWEEVVSSQTFKQLGVTVKNRTRQHINIKEIRAAIRAEQEEGKLHPGSYYVHLQDSQVSLACLLKGRSSSTAANRELQRSIPLHVSQRIRPFYGVRQIQGETQPMIRPETNQSANRAAQRRCGSRHSRKVNTRKLMLSWRLTECTPSRLGAPQLKRIYWPDPPVSLESGMSRRRQRRKDGEKKLPQRKAAAEAEKTEDMREPLQRTEFAGAETTEGEKDAEITEAETELLQRTQTAEAENTEAEKGAFAEDADFRG